MMRCKINENMVGGVALRLRRKRGIIKDNINEIGYSVIHLTSALDGVEKEEAKGVSLKLFCYG